jgi:hypothetical protein
VGKAVSGRGPNPRALVGSHRDDGWWEARWLFENSSSHEKPEGWNKTTILATRVVSSDERVLISLVF